MPKVVTIGSATMDVFVECDEANIVSVCSKDRNADFMSYPYGSKIEYKNAGDYLIDHLHFFALLNLVLAIPKRPKTYVIMLV